MINLYINYFSQPARAVIALCQINDIPHSIIELNLVGLQHKNKQFAKINPIKKVPAIEDTSNGLTMGESHSIMRYLCRKYHLDDHWYPTHDYLAMAKIDQYLDYHHQNTRKIGQFIYYTRVAKMLGKTDVPFDEAQAKASIQQAVEELNSIYLGKTQYIGGQEISIADLSAYFEVLSLKLMGYQISRWGNVKKWMDRMASIPQIHNLDAIFFGDNMNK